MTEALGALAFLLLAAIALLLSSRRLPPGAASFPFLLALFVAGCASWNADAQRAQMRATIEGVQAHQAWLDCLQQMREHPQDDPLMLHPCILDAMRETDEAVGAANEAIDAMDDAGN